MKNHFVLLISLVLAGFASANESKIYDKAAPLVEQHRVYDPGRILTAFERSGLGPMLQQIPAHGQGMLMASWTPTATPTTSPTFVILHGGGGVGSTNIKMAHDLKREYGANVLILDSHWSRGRKSNVGPDYRSYSRMISATDRVFDLLAAGQWLAQKGIDAQRTYPIGESQGGMVVMRAFTQGTAFASDIQRHFGRGIVLWPACRWWDSDHTRAHPVGPYHSPVIVFSGGRDYGSPISECPAHRQAAQHIHWEEATHAWMIATHGPFEPREDGNCNIKTERQNRQFDICYSENRTQETWRMIRSFIQ